LRDAGQARVLGGIALGRAGLDHQIDEASALVGKECSDFIAGAGVLRVRQGEFAEQHDDHAGRENLHSRTMHGEES